MRRPIRWRVSPKASRRRFLFSLITLVLLLLPGTAAAAEYVDTETYHLPQGQTVQDDLIVTAQEVIVDGTVEGDLVAFGAYVEMNGVVTGDLMAAAAEVRINGVVQDDARVAGAGVHLTGNVGDDLFAAAGGSWPGFAMFTQEAAPGRTLTPGLTIGPKSTIGGDAYLGAGQATVAGALRGNLVAGAESLTFNAQVDGDASLYANTLTTSEGARVGGNLKYTSTREEADLPETDGTVTHIVPEEKPEEKVQPNPLLGFTWWLLRTVMLLAGTLLLAALVWRFAPQLLGRPAAAIDRKPVEAGLYGAAVVVMAVPVAAALVFMVVLFWGWFPGGAAVFAFSFGLLSLAWLFSPILTGLWLGRRIFALTPTLSGDLYALLTGSGLIVLAGRMLSAVPCVGGLMHWLLFLLSFALAAGGILLARRAPAQEAAAA